MANFLDVQSNRLIQQGGGSRRPQIHPNGGYSVNDIDVKIPRSVTHSISYNLRGLLEFLYLYKRT
jgi:hypothetical protein